MTHRRSRLIPAMFPFVFKIIKGSCYLKSTPTYSFLDECLVFVVVMKLFDIEMKVSAVCVVKTGFDAIFEQCQTVSLHF